jgi:hypothetical protein
MNDLPVDRARLKRQFPELTDADLEAYETVTRRILEKKGAAERGRLTRIVMEMGRSARGKNASGAALTGEERLALSYLDSLEKMQGRTSKPGGSC